MRLWAGDGSELLKLASVGLPGDVGAQLLQEAVEGLSADRPLMPGSRLGEFTIIRELGRGGMGIVYEAQQDAPARRVALKVLRPGRAINDRDSKMFQREIEALARLNHPSIAAIYGAGQREGGEWFYAMELVRGRTLHRWLASNPAPSLPERLRLFSALCDAIHVAHQEGIVHRDIKPSNVMVDDQGRPRLLDFGLARFTDAESVTMATEVGQVVGTLPYMSPEQVAGERDRIDRRSDVYSLGVLLYEILTGQLPFNLTSRAIAEAARVIRDEAPQRPSRVWPALRGDLDVILCKTLEKQPERRYQSALDLAEDVRRHLTSRPITARPPSVVYTSGRFLARHRLGAAAVGIILIAAALVGLSLLAARESSRAAQDHRAYGEYLTAVQSAYTAALAGAMEEARAHLDAAPVTERDWEWSYVASLVRGSGRNAEMIPPTGVWTGPSRDCVTRQRPDGMVESLAFDGPSRALAPMSSRPWRLGVTPDGRYAIGAGYQEDNGTLRVYDTSANAVVATRPGHSYEMNAFDIDASGTRVVVGGAAGVARLFSVPSLDPLRDIPLPGHIWHIAFSPDAQHIAVAYLPNGLRVCRVSDGATVVECDTRGGMPQYPEYSPDGRLLVSLNDRESNLNLWDARTGELLRRVIIPEGPMCLTAIGDSGRLAVGCSDGSLRIFAFASPPGVPWAPILTLRDGYDCINFLASARDGSWVYADRLGKPGLVWKVTPTSKVEPHSPSTYTEILRAAQLALAAGSQRDAATLLLRAPVEQRSWEWRVLEAMATKDPARDAGLYRSDAELMIGFNAGSVAVPDRDRGIMYLFDPATKERSRPIGGFGREQPAWLGHVRDGRLFVTLFRSAVTVIDTSTGQTIAQRRDLRDNDHVCSATPDGARLLIGGQDGVLRVLLPETLETLHEAPQDQQIVDMRTSPDGALAMVVLPNNLVRIIRLSDYSIVSQCDSLPYRLQWPAFSHDCKSLLGITHQDFSLVEVDVATGKVIHATTVPEEPVVQHPFPDGSRIAVGCANGAVHIYPRRPDASGQWSPLVTLRAHTSWINNLKATEDGRRLIVDMSNQPDLIWDAGPRPE